MHVVIRADDYDDADDLAVAILEAHANMQIETVTILEEGRWVRWRRDRTGAWDVDATSVTSAS